MKKPMVGLGMIMVGLFVICAVGVAEAKWWPGIIHAHSTFSDGSRNPEKLVEQAKKALVKETKKVGAGFLIVTDHYEQIDSISTPFPFKFEKKKGSWIADDHGFDNYRDRFSKLASSDLVIVTGAEITTYWNGAASHLLALGAISSDDDLTKWHGQKDTQQAVIDRVNELGLLSVAAHPSLTALRYRQWAGEFDNLQFDPTVKAGLKGIEFFNDEPEGYSHTRDLWYLMRLRRGDDVFVTSGCDSHGWKDVYDADRWTRKTWVFSEKLEAKSLLEAMAQGHTYAAQHGASLENLNYIPGFQAQDVKDGKHPKFLFSVAFDKKISDSKTIQIYRDGKLIEDSVQTHKKENIEGLQKIAYVWEDKEAKEGEHNYVIEVEGVLLTSPIRLKLKTQPPPTADTAVIEGKYFFQEDPDRYLEIRKDGTCSWWYTDRPWEGDPRFPPPQAPQEGRWSRDKNTLHLFFENPGYSSYGMLLIKGNGVIVRITSGSAWVKKGARYSFSQKEVSGTYKYDGKVLILRPEGTCVYTDEDWRDKKSANGRWKIEGNLILPELDAPFPKDRVLILRVLDRDTLIQQGQWGQMRWVLDKK